MNSDFKRVSEAKYVLLTTFRKDGTPVATPLWAAPDGDKLLMWTVTDSYKVKRIKRNPSVTVAACDARGNPKGEPVAAVAEILDAPGTDHARDAIARRLRILGWITMKAVSCAAARPERSDLPSRNLTARQLPSRSSNAESNRG